MPEGPIEEVVPAKPLLSLSRSADHKRQTKGGDCERDEIGRSIDGVLRDADARRLKKEA